MRVVIFLSNAVAKVAIVIRQVSMGLYLPENVTGPVRFSKQYFIAILPFNVPVLCIIVICM